MAMPVHSGCRGMSNHSNFSHLMKLTCCQSSAISRLEGTGQHVISANCDLTGQYLAPLRCIEHYQALDFRTRLYTQGSAWSMITTEICHIINLSREVWQREKHIYLYSQLIVPSRKMFSLAKMKS